MKGQSIKIDLYYIFFIVIFWNYHVSNLFTSYIFRFFFNIGNGKYFKLICRKIEFWEKKSLSFRGKKIIEFRQNKIEFQSKLLNFCVEPVGKAQSLLKTLVFGKYSLSFREKSLNYSDFLSFVDTWVFDQMLKKSWHIGVDVLQYCFLILIKKNSVLGHPT